MSSDLQRLYQAHCVTQFRGCYFQFSKNLTKDIEQEIYGDTVCLKTERQKIEAFESNEAKPFLVVVHPTYGRPGVLAYRIWVGIERYISKSRVAKIETSGTGILKIAGLDKGGHQQKQIPTALKQLQYTTIHYHSRPFFKQKSGVNIADAFSLLKYTTHRINKRLYYTLSIDPLLEEQLFVKKRFYIVNWDTIKDLNPASQNYALMVSDGMTRRYTKFINNKENGDFVYNKAHDKVCRDFIGSHQPSTTPKGATRQLAKRNNDLINAKILASVPAIEGENLNTLFRPGAAFFKDYEDIYSRSHKLKSPENEVRELIALFGRQYHGHNRRVPSITDYATADGLIQERGYEEAKRFVIYNTRLAILSNWKDIKQLAALKKKEFVDLFEDHKAKRKSPSTEPKISEQQFSDYREYLDEWYIDQYNILTDEDLKKVDLFLAEFSSNEDTITYDRQIAIQKTLRLVEPTIQQWLNARNSLCQ